MQKWLDTLPIRPVTKRLVEHCLLDLPLSAPAVIDFGLDTPNHYRALRAVLFGDDVDEPQADEAVDSALRQRIIALDEVLGNGPKLDALVRTCAPQYAKLVQFRTPRTFISTGK